MKKLRIEDRDNCIPQSSSCIQWLKGDIPCLDIKNGAYLDDITFSIVNKLCELSKPADLSSLTLTCLTDKLDIRKPNQLTLLSILQFLIDSDCKIVDLVNTIKGSSSAISTVLKLDLKCLSQTDSFGNQVDYDQKSVFQSLINQSCLQKSNISDLYLKISEINSKFNSIPSQYIEPKLNSCLFSNKSTSDAVKVIADDYCSYKTKVGSIDELDEAIGRQPVDLKIKYISNKNFIQNVSSFAQSDTNQWVIIDDLLKRIEALEGCACKTKCEDINIGFEIEINGDGDGVTLHYTETMGAKIPKGWVDSGSKLKVKDVDNRERTYYNLNVSQGGTSNEIDLTPFNTSNNNPLNFCLEVNLTNSETGEVCNKCDCRDYFLQDGSCPVCRVCASSNKTGSGKLTMTYMEGSLTRTLVLRPGECSYVPKDITVLAIEEDGVDISSECDFEATSQYNCYYFEFSQMRDLPNGVDVLDPLDIMGVSIKGIDKSLIFNPVTLPNTTIADNVILDLYDKQIEQMNSSLGNASISFLNFEHVQTFTHLIRWKLHVKIIESISNDIMLKIQGPGFDNKTAIYLKPIEEDCQP